MHAPSQPSDWLRRWAHLVRPGGRVLDVACGSGRHLRWLHEHGFATTGVDRDAIAMQPLTAISETVVADIETGPWPFGGRRFDAVLVTNYLWRPLGDTLLAAVGDGGVYIHETFAEGQQAIGKPARRDFLLQPGELLDLVRRRPELRIVAFQAGRLEAPPRIVQRIVAVAGNDAAAAPLQGAHGGSG